MGDYRFLVAVMSEECAMCDGPITQGKPFYYEADSRKRYCRKCGRAIRIWGFDEAAVRRLVGVDADQYFKD